MATDDRQVINGDSQRDRIDDAARRIVRDIAKSSPPKSLETIKAAGTAAEAVIQDHVRRRAYDMWTNEGRPPGNGVDYWVRAEKEVLAEAHAG